MITIEPNAMCLIGRLWRFMTAVSQRSHIALVHFNALANFFTTFLILTLFIYYRFLSLVMFRVYVGFIEKSKNVRK